MVTITDSYQMQVSITPHGFASIQQPVVFPVSVESGAPFQIQYQIKNTGNTTDNLFGHLLVGTVEVAGSYWTENVPVNGVVSKTFNHPGITTTTTFILTVGRL